MVKIVKSNLEPKKIDDAERRKHRVDSVADFSKNGSNIFFAVLIACSYSILAIANTYDEDLLTNSTSTPLPIIQTSVPIVWFYYVTPALLFAAFLYFHLYLQGLWTALGDLPRRHADGRKIDEYVYPWLISTALLRARTGEKSSNRPQKILRVIEAAICILMAWFIVPIVILLFLIRFLPRHDLIGTTIHAVVFSLSVAAGIGFLLDASASLNPVAGKGAVAMMGARKSLNLYRVSSFTFICVFAVLLFLSLGAINGSPRKECKVAKTCGMLYAGAYVLENVGIPSFAKFEERDVSGKPAGWTSAKNKDLAAIETVRRATLRGRDLRHVNGTGAFMIGADLREANLRWSNLDKAQLQTARLQGANILSASLRESQLSGADLTKANLEDAYLTQSNMGKTILNGVIANRAHLHSADLRESTGADAHFADADMRYAKLDGSTLEHSDFSNANMQYTSLTRGHFRGSKFENAKLLLTGLVYADLAYTDFTGAVMQNADLTGARLTNAKFNLARMEHVKMGGSSDANGADFSDAKLGGAEIRPMDLRSALFVRADLSAARFENVNLSFANFAGAKLTNASFRNSTLVATKFREAKDLTQAQLNGACGDELTELPKGLTIAFCAQSAINQGIKQ